MLIQSVADVLVEANAPDTTMRVAALATAPSEAPPRARRLFVDISELVRQDAATGVQRVTRSVLDELLRTPPEGYTVQPVYATVEDTYRCARHVAHARFETPVAPHADPPIEYGPGDVFFGLDLQQHVVVAQERFYQQLRASGVHVYFLLYDLLPVTMPEYFPPGTDELHEAWLTVLTVGDGVIAISRDVADQYLHWLRTSGVHRDHPLRIGWCHCGADIANSRPTRGLPPDASDVLRRLGARPSFLMVGTIEPRKGHLQTIAAFDTLWQAGADVNLVIVGQRGWMMNAIAERVSGHPARGTRLLWLEDVSDEYLERLYATCCCLIAASEGEGYGLPLVEASRHGLPILARDLPVFREVAGPHASYFSGLGPDSLAAAIGGWLEVHAAGRHPRSTGIMAPKWKESVLRLKAILLAGEWYASWPEPPAAHDLRTMSMLDGPVREAIDSPLLAGFNGASSSSVEDLIWRMRSEVARLRALCGSVADSSLAGATPPVGEAASRWTPPSVELPVKNEYAVSELLGFSDSEFINAAYVALLHRPADERGFHHYRELLRSGQATKIDILSVLSSSEEGRAVGVRLHSFRWPETLQRWRRKRVIGPIVAWCHALVRLGSTRHLLAMVEAMSARESQEFGALHDVTASLVQQVGGLKAEIARLQAEGRMPGATEYDGLRTQQAATADRVESLEGTVLRELLARPDAATVGAIKDSQTLLTARMVELERQLGKASSMTPPGRDDESNGTHSAPPVSM